VIVATLFRNARPPERQKKVLTEAASILEIFRNPRLLLLLIFWSGLWFMYAVNLSFAPVYLVQYVKLPPSMVGPAPGLFQATNPLVIILLGPLIARVTRKMPTLPLMTGGLVLYIVGVLVMGITTDPWLVFFLGVVIYSIGEFASQPAFYSYVSKMAPPDRAALYMSYSFLPIAIGFTVAPPLVGWLYETVLLGMGAPRLFWAAIASVGLLALACLLLYNVFLARAQARDAAVAVASALATSSGTASVPEAHSAPGTPSAPAVRFPSRRSTLTGGALAVVALLFIPVVLGGALMAGSTAKPVVVAPGSATAYIAPLHGVAQAGQAVAKSVSLPRNATGNATFTLTWNDAAGTTPAAAQGPDDVKLSVASPEGGSFSKETQSPAGQQGSLMVVASQATSEAGGLYNVTITLVSSGSTVNTPLGIPVPGSSGSINWALNVSYTAASGP
jgi:MFS family permease